MGRSDRCKLNMFLDKIAYDHHRDPNAFYQLLENKYVRKFNEAMVTGNCRQQSPVL